MKLGLFFEDLTAPIESAFLGNVVLITPLPSFDTQAEKARPEANHVTRGSQIDKLNQSVAQPGAGPNDHAINIFCVTRTIIQVGAKANISQHKKTIRNSQHVGGSSANGST